MDPRTLRKSNRDSKWVQKPLWVFRVFLESNPHPNFARWPCDRDRCLTPWPELATLGINAASNLSFENCRSCLFCAKPWELSILNLVLAENLQELPCRNLNAWLSYLTIQKGLFSWQAHPSQPAEICYSILDPKLKCRRRNKVWISWILMFSMHSETANITASQAMQQCAWKAWILLFILVQFFVVHIHLEPASGPISNWQLGRHWDVASAKGLKRVKSGAGFSHQGSHP